MTSSSQFQGWTIAEAIRRTVPYEHLCERVAAHKTWRAAGSPRRFSFQSEDIHGREARHHNRREAELRGLYVEVITTYRRLFEELRQLLLQKRLLAWSRRESPSAPFQWIPPTAWKLMKIRNLRDSSLREATAAKTELFEVRIFPVIEAPDAIEHLSEMTLAEALRAFVFEDPQWESLCRRAKAIKDNDLLEPNHQRRLYSALWPVGCGQGDWSGALFYFAPHEGPVGHLANLVVGRRFARLMNYLSSGRLLAKGTTADGKYVDVPRSFWVREQTHIDVRNGDLIEYRPDARERSEEYSEPIFMGVILHKPNPMFHVKPTEHADLRSNTAGVGRGPTDEADSPTRAASRSESSRRRPVAEDVARALRKHGIERDPGLRTWKEIAVLIAPDLSRQPRDGQGWTALTTAVKRHYKKP